VVVFAVSCVVYGFGLGRLGLVSRDEPRYCVVAWAMVATGDFVTPRFNGAVYLDKPPLLHWMNAASFALLGKNEFAARLPTMLTAALCTALVYAMARYAFGHRQGLLAAAVLASCGVWFGMARYVRFDTPLALAVTAAAWWAWLASEKGPEGRHYYVLATVAAALGILVKGPIALVIAGGAFAIYLALVRRLRLLAQVPWVPVLLVMALIVVPWFAACERANPGSTAFFLGHENLWRITRKVIAPGQQPWWHVIVFLVGGVIPWTICVPGAVWQGVREARGEDSPARRLSILLLVWVAVTVLVYIPPPVKFFQYIIPAIPALALLTARHVAGPGARWSLLVLGVLLAAAGVGVPLFAPRFLALCGLPTVPFIPVATALGLLAGGAVIWSTLRGRRGVAVAAAAVWTIGLLHLASYVAKDCNPYYVSDRVPLLTAARYARHGETLVCYGYTPCASVFYYPYRVTTVGYFVPEYDYPGNEGRLDGLYYPYEEAEAVFSRPPAMVGIVRSREWAELQARVPNHVQLLERCEPYVIFRTVPSP
jgi:4-amino-4-deoxy-L-arabinose transferase-like glycosyltransferase